MVVDDRRVEHLEQSRHDLADIFRFEANIDHGTWSGLALEENQIAEVAITGDEDPILFNRLREHLIVRCRCDRPIDIVAGDCERSGNDAADVRIQQEPQAARA